MNRSRNLSLLIASLAMACVFTIACDSGTQEPEAPAQAPAQGASAPLESGEGTELQSQSPLPPTEVREGLSPGMPADFPSDVPIYPGSVPAQGKSAVADGIPLAAVQLRSNDSAEVIYDFYRDKLSRDGWTLDERKNLEGKNAVTATNGDCKAMMVAGPSEEGGSQIFLITECAGDK